MGNRSAEASVKHQPELSKDDGAPPGTRTPNPLIKSQLLCQLS